MKIEDVLISQELERIRIRHGLDPVPFEPTPPVVDIDEDLTDIDQVERLFHASGLLVRDGRPVLAYIRDHTSRPLGPYPQPEQCNKVHFTVCNALKSMKTRGRFERYRVTSRDTNRYLVDIGAAWGRAEEREILLHPCQYCLGIIKYQQFDYEMPGHQKKYIVENFDVKELFGLLHRRLSAYQQQNTSLWRATKNAKPAKLPSGYPRTWAEISENIRRNRKYTCEACLVQLNDHPGLLDVHHVDGDKQNIRDSNLRCLCKLCHHDEHPHYKVDKADRALIETQRAGQHLGEHQVE